MKSNKKQLLISIIGLLLLTIVVTGLSYAIYSFIGTGTKNNIINVGKIDISYNENTRIQLDGAYPEIDSEGISSTRTGSTLDFDIISDIRGNQTINYAIGIDSIVEGTTLTEEYIKIYVLKNGSLVNGFETGVGKTINEFAPYSILNEIDDHVILTDSIVGATGDDYTGPVTTNYTIKAWVSDQYDLPTTITNNGSNHSAQTSNETFAFKIKVVATDKQMTILSSTEVPIITNVNVYSEEGQLAMLEDSKIKIQRLTNELVLNNPLTRANLKSQDNLEVELIYNKNIKGIAPNLTLKFGTTDAVGVVSDGTINKNTITYDYTITPGDNGIAQIKSISGGGLIDDYGNVALSTIATPLQEKVGRIEVDTTIPEITSMAVAFPMVGTYKAGQVVRITTTYSEAITGTIPTLAITFGGVASKGKVNSEISETTITYTYTVVEGDNGLLNIESLTGGNLSDVAGNVASLILPELVMPEITADTAVPVIETMEVKTATGTYKAGTSVKVRVWYNEIIQGTIPTMAIRFGGVASKGTVSGAIHATNKRVVDYIYTITSGDNGVLSVYSLTGTSLTDVAGNKASNTNPALTGNIVTADTATPTITYLGIVSPEAGTYKAGQVVRIRTTYSEEVQGTPPNLTIQIGTGSEKVLEGTIYSSDPKHILYYYTIVAGDNGNIKVTGISGQTPSLTDSVSNIANINLPMNNGEIYQRGYAVTADTAIPVIETMEVRTATGTYKAGKVLYIRLWYDEVIQGTIPTMAVRFGGVASKGTVSGAIHATNKRVVDYTYTITSGDNGVLSVYSLAGTSLTDAVGNKASNSIPALTGNTVTADTAIPVIETMEVRTATGTYKAGKVLYIRLWYDEVIQGTIPTMAVRFGGLASKGIVSGAIHATNKRVVDYTYTITSGDNGVLSVYSLTGTSLTDAVGNKASNTKPALTGNTVTADTTAPACSITSSLGHNTLGYYYDLQVTSSATDLHTEPYSWTDATTDFSTSTTITIKVSGTYYAWVRDAAGNVGNCRKVVNVPGTISTCPERFCPSGQLWNSRTCRCAEVYYYSND